MGSILLVLALSWICAVSAESCNSSYTQPGFKIDDHVIKHIPISTREQCEQECKAKEGCHSINYYFSTKKCELNGANHLSNPVNLVPQADSQYIDFPERPVKKCSKNLCSELLACKPAGENYECVPCKEYGEVLHFPRKSTEDKVVVDEPFASALTVFTLALWVQADTSTSVHTTFSFATSTKDDALTIILTSTYSEFIINMASNMNAPPVLDGKWHHLCLTWESTTGQFNFYIDGTVKSQGTIQQGKSLNKGALILGQEQDSYKGGLDATQALQGNLASVNMWDKVLTSNEVSALFKTCPSSEGNVLKWSSLKSRGVGSVKLVCSSFCP